MPDRFRQILLIEDDPADAGVIERLLSTGARSFRAAVRRVASLREDIELLRTEAFEVALLDLHLPDGDGIEALRAIRAENPDISVVLLSGLDDERTALEALQKGAQDYLVKGALSRALLFKSLQYAHERKRAERAIRGSQERERFERAFEGSLDAIVMHSTADGRILEANSGFLRLTGLRRSEVLEHRLVSLPVWRKSAIESLERAIAGGIDVRNREVLVRQPDGSQRFALVSAADVSLSEGASRLWFFRDVTEKRKSDQAVRELSARLLRLQDDERRRLARELHDGISPPLVALTMELSALKRARDLGRAGKRVVSRSLDLAKQCLRDLRTASYLLHPPLLDETGLPAALRWYADGFAERSGIRVEVILPETFGRLDRDVETAAFRLIQESLSNVHRHSGSDTVEIRVDRDDRRLLVEVVDYGCGFANERLEGVGIAGMRERVRQLGGELELSSTGSGARVRVTLPLEERAA